MNAEFPTSNAGCMVIRAGWLVDGLGGPPQSHQLVTIDKGFIQSITPAHSAVGQKNNFVDLSHATILPALMDAHVHLAFSGTLDAAKRKAQLKALPQEIPGAIEKNLEQHLKNGIVAVRDAGDRHGAVLDAKQQRYAVGELTPHVAATCWAWHAQGRYGRMIGRTPNQGENLYDALEKGLGHSDHIKLLNSGINSLNRYGHQTPPQFSEAQLRDVARMADRKGLPVMVHANGEAAVRTAVEAGCDSIEHGYFMGVDNLKRMADTQTFWVPTVVPMAALTQNDVVPSGQADVARRTLDHQLAQIAQALQWEVTIALGTDAGSMGVDHGLAVRQELQMLMTAGVPLTKAIGCATLNAARLMQLEKCGALLPGWHADFLVVPGSPEELPESLGNIEAMCIKGRWAIDPTVA